MNINTNKNNFDFLFNDKSNDIKNVYSYDVDEDDIPRSDYTQSMYNTTSPEKNTSNLVKKRIYPPHGWWKPMTYYIVEASFSKSDPISGYIFFTGKLNESNEPGEKSGFLQHIGGKKFEDVIYLRAIIELTDVQEVLKVPNRGKLPQDVSAISYDELKS